jgi:hypothetical protein
VSPGILLKDPEADLQPVASYLMSLGISPTQLQQLACLRPELLAAPVDDALRPFVAHVKSLGGSAAQAGEILLAAPAAALRPGGGGDGGDGGGGGPFAARLAALAAAGIGPGGVAGMLAKGETRFLTEKGAPREALAALAELGFNPDQVRRRARRGHWLKHPSGRCGRHRPCAGARLEGSWVCAAALSRPWSPHPPTKPPIP